MDVESLAKELILKNMTPEQQMVVLDSVRQSVAQAKEVQKKKIGENVDLVVQALKKIESDIRDRFDAVGNTIEKRVSSIKDGRDGANGKDGRDGKDGKSGRDGLKGERGADGQAGRDGVDGVDGISVVNANIDFDGSLVISLSDGREINVGEVVSQDVAEKIRVISTMSTNAAIAIKDEGTSITSSVKNINFVGATVTATNSGDDVTVTVSGGGGSGTVTSVAALTLGTSGTDLSSTVATSTTTPVITLNVPTASATNRGALSSADWTTFNNKGSGTVTSVTGTSPVASSGGATPAISLASGYGDTLNPYASKTANFVLAAPNGSAGVPTFRAIVAADIPTLNQNTTGTAAGLSTTLVATSGGTGQSSYAVGDLLYASTTTALSKLADVATGNALISGGVGVAPSWGKVGLTTHVSGTLPTANGGTNLTSFTSGGVVYASSTSALATGSSLVFDGASFLDLKAGANQRFYRSDNARYGFIYADNNGLNIGATSTAGEELRLSSTGSQIFYTGVTPTEALRLTNTSLYTASGINVGIGTNSPQAKLHINSGAGSTQFRMGPNSTSSDRALINYNSTTNRFTIDMSGNDSVIVDGSGNVGIGITPSVWNSNFKALQISTGGSLSAAVSQSSFVDLGGNFYQDSGGTERYIASSTANKYRQYAGVHSWYTAASGTAGNAITFTQAMTLDASGNLGVGATSIPAGFRLYASGGSMLLDNNTAFRQKDTAGNNTLIFVLNSSNNLEFGSGSHSGGLTITTGNSNITFTANSAERARISSDGTFRVKGAGTAGSTDAFQVAGTAPASAASLDSSGNLLVGKTSAGVFTTVGTEINATGFVAITRNGSVPLLLNRETSNGEIAQFRRSNTTVGSIDVTTTATSYVTSSDYRLKNTIAPMTGALAKVAALKPVTYKWNADGSDGEGFIAHELAEVCPHAVTGEKDGFDADGNPKYQGIDTSFLVATLTAAIQEQQALITQLTARITALETA